MYSTYFKAQVHLIVKNNKYILFNIYDINIFLQLNKSNHIELYFYLISYIKNLLYVLFFVVQHLLKY